MNKKSLSLVLAAVMLAAIVPIATAPAALAQTSTPLQFRIVWNGTAISINNYSASDIGSWFDNTTLPIVYKYPLPIPILPGSNLSVTKTFNGSVVIAFNSTTNFTQGNVIVLRNDSKLIQNFTVYMPIVGDPTIIQSIDSTVEIESVGGTPIVVPYTTVSKYVKYTSGWAMAAVKVNLEKPIPASKIKYIAALVKVYYTDGSGNNKLLQRPVVIVVDHGNPAVSIDTFEYNQTDEPLQTTGWYVADVSDKSAWGYFNDSSPLAMNVSFADDVGVYHITAEIYNCENGALLGDTAIWINNTRHVIGLIDRPLVPNDIAKGIPPGALDWDTMYFVENYLLNSSYILGGVLNAPGQLNPNDFIVKYEKTLVKITPVNVTGTDQQFILRFSITNNIVHLNNTDTYRIVITAEDTAGKVYQENFIIGDDKKPVIIIASPSPGSIYNAQGWSGVKLQFKIIDPDSTCNGGSSNITSYSIELVNQDGTRIPIDQFFTMTNLFNSPFTVNIGDIVTAYVNARDLAPKYVPNSDTTPLFVTLTPASHALPDGKYTIIVNATDRVGHNATAKTWFIIDTTAPRITSVTINGHTYNTSVSGSRDLDVTVPPYVDISWNATDALPGYPNVVTSGILYYHVTVTDGNGNTIGVYTLSTPHLKLTLNPGTYRIELYAQDAAGNTVDPSQYIRVIMNVSNGTGLPEFVGLAKLLNGTFVVSPRASADSYATLMFAAPTTGPLPVRYSDNINLSKLTSKDYIISIGGPVVNSVTKYYQEMAPVKMEVVNGKVQVVTPNETFTWAGPHGKWWNVTSGYFVIQILKDPKTGATIFMVYGTDRDSTAAGSYWLYEQFSTGNIAKFNGVYWVVGKWTDTDGSVDFDFLKGSPDDHNGFSYGDSIQIVAEG